MSSKKIIHETNRRLITGAYIKTYVYLFNVARLSIEEAKAERKDDAVLYKCMTSIVFLAFCLESYLNHLGAEGIENWQDDFESLKPLAKLRLLMSKHGRVNLANRPFQSFSEIFKVRNQLAHGKTVWVSEEHPKEPLTNWQKLCNVNNTKRLYADTEKMIRFIHLKITGNPNTDPFLSGFKFSGFIQE